MLIYYCIVIKKVVLIEEILTLVMCTIKMLYLYNKPKKLLNSGISVNNNIDIKNNSGNDKYDKYVIKQVDYKSNFIVVWSGKCWDLISLIYFLKSFDILSS